MSDPSALTLESKSNYPYSLVQFSRSTEAHAAEVVRRRSLKTEQRGRARSLAPAEPGRRFGSAPRPEPQLESRRRHSLASESTCAAHAAQFSETAGGRTFRLRPSEELENCIRPHNKVNQPALVFGRGRAHRQDSKSTWRMPWHQEPKKDVDGCDKPRLGAEQPLTRGSPNGKTRRR